MKALKPYKKTCKKTLAVCSLTSVFAIFFWIWILRQGFPGNSADKKSAYNAGDPGLIPELGSSPREGNGDPLQCFWASLVAPTVEKLPGMQETQIRSLGWEDPLEDGMATHPVFLPREFHIVKYYLAIKENAVFPLRQHGWTKRVLCKVNCQTQRDKYHMISLLCVI